MNNIDNEPSDAKVMGQLHAVRAIIDRHGFPSSIHQYPAGARSLTVYPQMEQASRDSGFQQDIDRLSGIDIGFWYSRNDNRRQVFTMNRVGTLNPPDEVDTPEEAAAHVLSMLIADGDDRIQIIDFLPPADRMCITWQYPTGTGTERFAVYNRGSRCVTLYHPEGIELDRYEHPDAATIAKYEMNGSLRILGEDRARRIVRQLWGKPAYEHHYKKAYV